MKLNKVKRYKRYHRILPEKNVLYELLTDQQYYELRDGGVLIPTRVRNYLLKKEVRELKIAGMKVPEIRSYLEYKYGINKNIYKAVIYGGNNAKTNK